MVLKINIFASLLILLSLSSEASITRLGEFQTPTFYGSHLPEFEFNPYSYKFYDIEQQIKANYVERNINDEFISLNNYIKNEFYQGLNCPDESYKEKSSYIRFLNRLQVMSYLFQSLREHEYVGKKLDLKRTCQVNWTQMMNSCKPQTKEMKFFQTNILRAFEGLSPVSASFESKLHKFRRKWLGEVKKKKGVTLTQVQIQKNCQGRACSYMQLKEVPLAINKICEREQKLFLQVCSEKDNLYGLSIVPEVYPLIASSSGLRGIDKDNRASGCVKRFSEQNKNLEHVDPFLSDMFSILYDYNLSESPQNPQGRLFTIGAAKEFIDKGLVTIFKPAPKPEPVPKKEKPKLVRVSNPGFQKIVLPKFIKKKRPKRKKKAIAVKVVKEWKSSFLMSCEIRAESNLDSIDIDMKKFKTDYIFTLTEKQKILPIVKRYSSVVALKSMKKLDRLGSKEAPMPLKFLKFLIDEKLNQNLFNINLVLGEKFYVINDIDKKIKKTNFVKLAFKTSQFHGWQISELKP